MLSSGLLTQYIEIEHLRIVRDEYGSDLERWERLFVCKANVRGFDNSALVNTNSEILIENRLQIQIRKDRRLLFDAGNHYRIRYKGKIFNVLGINSEDRDTVNMIVELKNV
jgi:head-tail adaptor